MIGKRDTLFNFPGIHDKNYNNKLLKTKMYMKLSFPTLE